MDFFAETLGIRLWRIGKSADAAFPKKILKFLFFAREAKGIDENQFDFHFLRNDVFDVHGAAVSHANAFLPLGKACQIGGEFDENAVTFDASDDSDDRLPDLKTVGIFLPSAQKFLMRQRDPAAPSDPS